MVLSSSGTTGAPKLVALSVSQLMTTAAAVARHHGLDERDRCFNPLPLFHVNAEVVAPLASLAAGATVVLDDRFHRRGFWELMGRREISWINAVPAIVARLGDLQPGEAVPSGIRFVRSASAPLAPATLARFEAATGVAVLESYGMTEAASQITANPLDGRRKPGTVGVPVGVELRVVRRLEPVSGNHDGDVGRASKTCCAPGVVGEVEVRGPVGDHLLRQRRARCPHRRRGMAPHR